MSRGGTGAVCYVCLEPSDASEGGKGRIGQCFGVPLVKSIYQAIEAGNRLNEDELSSLLTDSSERQRH